jgi:hypothetical protein
MIPEEYDPSIHYVCLNGRMWDDPIHRLSCPALKHYCLDFLPTIYTKRRFSEMLIQLAPSWIDCMKVEFSARKWSCAVNKLWMLLLTFYSHDKTIHKITINSLTWQDRTRTQIFHTFQYSFALLYHDDDTELPVACIRIPMVTLDEHGNLRRPTHELPPTTPEALEEWLAARRIAR